MRSNFRKDTMDFELFLKYLPKILKESLPATAAHLKMAPFERVEMMKKWNYEDKNPRKSAVMMLFYPKVGVTHLILIVRNAYPGVHSSQISFPGGKAESTDTSYQDTALRETYEEVGISKDHIRVVREFSEIYIPPSNFIVYPFMGISEQELVFKPSEYEVAELIELSLTDFLDDAKVVNVILSTSYATEAQVPAFKIDNHIIWGATAMLMSELKEVLKSALSH